MVGEDPLNHLYKYNRQAGKPGTLEETGPNVPQIFEER